MPQESEETIWSPAYHPIDPSGYYPVVWHPSHVPDYIQAPHFTKIWEQPIPFLSTGSGIAAPTTQEGGAIDKTWHDEWEAEPRPFGSRRPLALLTKPADINLTTHPQDAERVYLNHWDRQHEPVGAAAQRVELQRKQDDAEKRMLALKAETQKERRRKVRQAAEIAGVIDLTKDSIPRKSVLCEYGPGGDGQSSASVEMSVEDWCHTWPL